MVAAVNADDMWSNRPVITLASYYILYALWRLSLKCVIMWDVQLSYRSTGFMSSNFIHAYVCIDCISVVLVIGGHCCCQVGACVETLL